MTDKGKNWLNRIEIAAQALADDAWKPPVKLAHMSPSDARRYRRQAEIVVDALDLAPVARHNGWQPIETAPKDGTRVLLWTTSHGDRSLTDYLVAGGTDLPFENVQIGSHLDDYEGWRLELVGNPTHWMPLPVPPQQSQPAEK